MKLKRTLEHLNSAPRNWGALLAVSLISVIALILRFKGLTFQSYWFDELYSVATAIPGNSFQDILDGSFRSVHPPLFHSMLWGWFKLFGFSELSGRAFPALFGTLCVPVIYLLGKDLFNVETGIYAAAFAAFNIFLIQYSQEVRPYSLLLLLSLMSLLFYVRTLKTGKRMNLVSFILATTALLYTHYYGFLILAVEFFFLGIYLLTNQKIAVRLLVFCINFGNCPCPGAYTCRLIDNCRCGKNFILDRDPQSRFHHKLFSGIFRSRLNRNNFNRPPDDQRL